MADSVMKKARISGKNIAFRKTIIFVPLDFQAHKFDLRK